jgi:hypothetical protein
MTMNDDDKLLTIKEAAAFLRTSVATVATLRFWRSQGVGRPRFQIGRRIPYWLSETLARLDEPCGRRRQRDHRRGHRVSTEA